eukprot:7267424-Karenia_brevis.AAC.1
MFRIKSASPWTSSAPYNPTGVTSDRHKNFKKPELYAGMQRKPENILAARSIASTLDVVSTWLGPWA